MKNNQSFRLVVSDTTKVEETVRTEFHIPKSSPMEKV